MITLLKNKLIEIPKQVVEIIIHDDVSEKDSWLNYNIIHIKTNKMYYGLAYNHPIKPYWHSCENEEFKKLFANPNEKFKYVIVASGTKKAMYAKEKAYLTKNNATKSNKYWNGNNGITSETEVDYDVVNTIIKNTKDKKYPIIVKTKEQVIGDVFKQVRGVEFVQGQVTMIKDEINGTGGSTENCEPLIYLEDYFHKGNDCGIGGNHTHRGFVKSKGVDIETQTIPKKDWSKLCEDGIQALGLGFNPRDKVEKKPTEVEDAVRYCLGLHDSKKEWWTTDIKKYFKNTLNFKPTQIEKIKSKVEDELKKTKRKSKKGLVFRSYDPDSEYHHELLDKVKLYTSDDVYCVYYSSSNVDLERLVSGAGDKKTIVCVVYHPTPTAETTWNNTDLNKNGVLPYCKKRIENSIKWFNGDTDIVFTEMDAWVPDTK
tara:strand:+ start:67 stop:1350 length:1284 start_codon:yes stop_codon:yes gene_type:complete